MAGTHTGKIIVVKKKRRHQGHESHGAWKVAFADFAVAMMAFFLVLWLQEAASNEQKNAITAYFEDPKAFTEGGSKYVIDFGGRAPANNDNAVNLELNLNAKENSTASSAEIDAEILEELKRKVEQRKFNDVANQLKTTLENNDALKPYKDQVIFSVTDEGLQIQLVDKEFRPMFNSGSDKIMGHAEGILKELANTLQDLPNKMVISGHTDALAFNNRKGYSNWELSSERANSARRALQGAGVLNRQITQVVGHGSSNLFDPKNPLHPVNRRVSILILSKESQDKLDQANDSQQAATQEIQDDTAASKILNDTNTIINDSEDDNSGNAEKDAKVDSVSVQSFRRQQVLRSQQEEINASNRALINAPLPRNQSASKARADLEDVFEFSSAPSAPSSAKGPAPSTNSDTPSNSASNLTKDDIPKTKPTHNTTPKPEEKPWWEN